MLCISKLKPENGTLDNFVPTIFIEDDTNIGLAREKPNAICLQNVCITWSSQRMRPMLLYLSSPTLFAPASKTAVASKHLALTVV